MNEKAGPLCPAFFFILFYFGNVSSDSNPRSNCEPEMRNIIHDVKAMPPD